MRRRFVLLLFLMSTAVTLTFGVPTPAVAQDAPPPSSATTIVVRPAPDIVPRPNSGAPPAEAGDRGGALQLGLLALVVLVIGGTAANLVRQSRRARAGAP